MFVLKNLVRRGLRLNVERRNNSPFLAAHAHNTDTMRLETLSHFLASLGVCFCSSAHMRQDNPIVEVNEGKIQGAVKTLLEGTPYYSFKGIPYAQPPVGELRFSAPLPPKPWSGVREALNHGPVCPQYDITIMQLIEGNEDCLYLNVYTKSLGVNSKLPVMFYIHGGAYMSGSGDSDTLGPEFFLLHDVVIVTLNYRLEVLGFLCLDTPEVPGNAGMKDQVLALKWVKKNIAKFGGDPDNVTIFGESAGSSSVSYHMLSPMSKGLFHRAICQSGMAIHDWSVASGLVDRAFRSAKVLGKEINDKDELLSYLRSVPAIDLAKMTLKTKTEDEKYRGLPIYFVPVAEKKFENVEPFLTKEPIEAILSKDVNKVPFIAGYNSAEGMLMLLDKLNKTDFYNKHPSFFVPREIAEVINRDKLKEFGNRVKRFYVGDKDLSNDTAVEIVNMQTDINFSYNIHRFLQLYAAMNTPMFMYRFEYETDLNAVKNAMGLRHMKEACHADDIFYLFCNVFNKDFYNEQPKLRDIVFKLTKLWVDFAKTGNPTPDNSFGVTWKPYTTSNREFIKLNEQFSMGRFADRERTEFWDKLYCESGRPCLANKRCNL